MVVFDSMNCALCSSSAIARFLDLGQQPLANKYPTAEQFSTEDFFPLQVHFCAECKNVQLGTIVSRERMFEDYYYLSSVNPGLVRHFEALAQSLKDAKFVVDIGSNDGILLRPLKKVGIHAVGIEPSVNVSKIANDEELETVTAFFNAESARDVEKRYGKPDVIVASSIFTHLEDPHTFLDDIVSFMADKGRFIVEVEYIGNIIRDIQFERFYLDRIFYYSLSSFDRLVRQHGMYVHDVVHIEPHGGSLRITARRVGDGAPQPRVAEFIAQESTMLTSERLTEFSNEARRQVDAFKKALETFKAQGVSVGGYGAPARLATITNFGNIGPELMPFTVDDSPLKQNRFSPGKHIPIVPNTYLKEHPVDLLVVFAYEYLADIRKKTGNAYRYFVPIPPREVT